MVEITLREIRQSKNLTIKDLSKKSGVNAGYISEIECGKKKPTIDILCKLAKALKCDVSELYKCT